LKLEVLGEVDAVGVPRRPGNALYHVRAKLDFIPDSDGRSLQDPGRARIDGRIPDGGNNIE
jgi:hypothetical protein